MSHSDREYKREGLYSYVVFEQEVEYTHELKILSVSQPNNLLPLEVRNQNGSIYFYYNITNERTLEKVVEKTPLSHRDIKMLVRSILEAIEMTGEYLLEPDGLFLDKESIYKSNVYRFLYLPGRRENIVDQLSGLIMYLMDRIDYKDQEAVVYMYHLYRMIKEGSFDIESLRNLDENQEETAYYKILQNHQEESRKLQEFSNRKREEKIEEEKRQEGGVQEKGQKEGDKIKDRKERMITKLSKNKILYWIPLGIFSLLLFYEGYYIYGKSASIEIQVLCIVTFLFFLIYLFGLYYWIRRKKESKKMHQILTELSQKEDGFQSNETTVLQENYIEKNLAKLVPVDEEKDSTIWIRKEGFMIGNMLGCADGKIDRKEVSRMHAIIEKKKEKFFIKDLKSTNGTIVNGTLLKEGECVRIRDGDEIQFGSCSYTFRDLPDTGSFPPFY